MPKATSATGKHIWAEKYDRQLEDIFSVQEEVTREIVSAIAPEIELAESTKLRKRPKSLSAYEIALRAWDNARQAQVTANVPLRNQSISETEEALRIDPDCILALKTFAWAKWQHVFCRTTEKIDAAWNEGIGAAQKALELDRTDGLLHWCKGIFFTQAPNPEGTPERIDEALTSISSVTNREIRTQSGSAMPD